MAYKIHVDNINSPAASKIFQELADGAVICLDNAEQTVLSREGVVRNLFKLSSTFIVYDKILYRDEKIGIIQAPVTKLVENQTYYYCDGIDPETGNQYIRQFVFHRATGDAWLVYARNGLIYDSHDALMKANEFFKKIALQKIQVKDRYD